MTDDDTDTDDDAGVPDTDPRHIDPAGDVAEFMEGASFDVDLGDETDVDELREFVERAEAGEFGADPGVEATVRIARAVLESATDDTADAGDDVERD